MKQIQTQIDFPSFISYNLLKFLPTLKLFLRLGIFYLIGFILVDCYKYPSQIHEIIVLRFAATVPLLFLYAKLYFLKQYSNASFCILIFGAISYIFLLLLYLLIVDKNPLVPIVPFYYFTVVVAISPLFNKKQLVTIFTVASVVGFILSVTLSINQQVILQVYPHIIGIIVFTVLSSYKIADYSYEHYQIDKNSHRALYLDELTGVYNRRGILQLANIYIEENKTSGLSFSILIIDLDDFKKINDSFGHKTGDLILTKTAQKIKYLLNANANVGRIGGEEFLVLLVNKNPELNRKTANEILLKIRTEKYLNSEKDVIPVSVSIGMKHQTHNDSLHDLMHAADLLMYKAKISGKNRLEVSK